MSTAAQRLRERLAAMKLEKGKTEAEQTPEQIPDTPDTPEYISVVSTEGMEGAAIGFKNMLLELEDKLNSRIDNFPYLLRDIHQHLRKDPEVVTVLTDEEIGLIVRGLKTMTGTILGVETKATGAGTRAKKKMPVTADML